MFVPPHSPQSAIRNSQSTTAFTLVELMTVLFIIMVLSGLIVGGSKYALTKAARSRAEAEVAAMENALESFKADNGYYPMGDGSADSSTNIYNALAVGPKTYMTFRANQLHPSLTFTNIADPFGANYYYLSPGATNTVSFDLWSGGPDNVTNTADDIVNWRR